MIGEDLELEVRLRRYGQALTREVRVTPALHSRILSGVQAGSAVRRSRGVWLQLAGAAAVVLIGLGVWAVVSKVRADALAASAPRVESVTPRDHAVDVPLLGQFRVTFAARPTGMPGLIHQPADGSQEAAQWEGDTLVVKYAGLHPSRRYDVVLTVPYQSRYGDRARLEKHWTFTTEGPAQISSTVPATGQKDVARNGVLQVVFVKRPPVDPVLRFEPADGKLETGQWKENAFVAAYTGLRPERSYKAILDLELGSAAANVRQEWSFVTEPGAPPNGVQLIWLSTTPFPKEMWNRGNTTRLLAYDWSGKLRGTLYANNDGKQAPNGSALWVPEGVLDSSGNLIEKVGVTKGGPIWADDSRHTCEMHDASGQMPQGNGEAGWLWVRTLGSSPRRVVQFGSYGGQSAPNVVGCSFLTGRAVLTQHAIAWITQVQVVDIASGRVLFSHQYSSQEVVSMTASHDGRFLAETTSQLDAQGRPGPYSTNIRRVSDGVIVARLDGERVAAFSWDGSTVMLAPDYGSTRTEFRMLNWQTGKVLWKQPVSTNPERPYMSALPEPGGSGFVVGLGTWLDVPHPESVWIVRGNGSAQQIAGPFYTAF
jgi:hypothetical protein